MTDLLNVRDLHVEFRVAEGVIRAVRGISFRVRPGSTVALVGESGSGKSVVAQAIMGILPRPARITKGEILFSDPEFPKTIDIAKLDPESGKMRSIRGGNISIIFQEPMTSLSPLHTVGNQVGEAVMLHRDVDSAQARELTVDMLRLVGFPDPKRAVDTYPFELSGGLRQRAMIAMALICRPSLLVADEPTTALDVTIQAQILKLLADLQGELGMAVLMITHDLGVVANVAEEVVVMYRGEVMEAGEMRDIFAEPRHPYLKALLRAVPRFHMHPGERLVPIREIKSAGGKMLDATSEPWPAGADAAGPLLSVGNITKRFETRKSGWFSRKPAGGGVLAVDDVSFEIRRGECLGLVGESGCGKTTLSKILMRALTPDTGSILFNDRGSTVDVLGLEGDKLIKFRRNLQFIFQDPFSSLNPRMTVYDIVAEPLIIHDIGDAEHRRALVKELMNLVGLDVRHLKRYPHSFSGGQRQRIGIARALALRPDLLICDEPVSALDVSIQAQILNLLKDLKDKLGLTYLFISHNLAVVDYIADRIMVMCRGRIVEIAPRAALFRNPVHPYTRALLTAVPDPDPNARLDLALLREGRASDPGAWAPPFTIDGDNHPGMIDLGNGHLVRAKAHPALLELAS
ncbi:peptide/nickel transport system ATP-binding protein [Skermanella aerolata]|uniref:ABC transporter ATP-binding protein n=1 Tax=Skermanella aerolata TaxID=393310 RepID=A0A512DNT4_9PROT|nr:ABC transporter ATP-binding protein [Skermanella aerolata]KJB95837.1 ABC transporter ATP-binding protein [Skermanella aerolata KACC 11604]GEO38145.1 ABC transporter ATP-binding protein [Skermanella aerolata]